MVLLLKEGKGPKGKGKWDGEGKKGEGAPWLFFGGGRCGRPEISPPRSFLKVGAYGYN